MYHVYILKSRTSSRHYIGSTEDIDNRLKEHNANNVRSTKNKGPWLLIHQEEFINKHDALLREREIKGYKGNSLFKKLVKTTSPSSPVTARGGRDGIPPPCIICERDSLA